MTKHLLFSGLILLMACPTPPTPNNSPNSTPGNNSASTQNGNNGGNGGQNAGNKGAQNPQPKGTPPGEPAEGDQGDKGEQGNQGEQGNGEKQANNQVGNPDGPPPGSVPSAPNENGEQPMENQELKVPSDEEMEKDGSIMGVFNDLGGQDLPAQYTQKTVEGMDHITLSGTITCKGEGCDTALILRITPSFQPSEKDGPLSEELKMEEGGTITSTEITKGGGKYTVKVPKSDGSVVLELLMDEDDDGKASMGEKFVIYEGGGGIPINADRSDLNFEFAPVNLKAPLGGAKPPGNGDAQ